MAYYSNILSNFSNQTTTTGTDILSKGQIVDSSNSSVRQNDTTTRVSTGHTKDGYFIIGNLLIQFSATSNPNGNLNNGNYYTFTFPINYGNNNAYNVTCIPTFYSTASGNCEATTYTNSSVNIYDPSANFNVFIGNSHNGNIYWFAIGPKPDNISFASSTDNPLLSSFLSNFSGGSRIDGFNCDIMSNAFIIGSLNTSLGHTIDGVMFLGKLLIQFSATISPTDPPTGTGKIITFPVSYDSSSNLLNILQSGTRQSSPAGWTGINITASTASNFTFNSFNNTGNISWISLGLAPTRPIYTNITNSGSITYISSNTMDSTGKYQYACVGGSTVGIIFGYIYKNLNYGYGPWVQTDASFSSWSSIKSDSTGQYLAACTYSSSPGYIYTSSNYGSGWTQTSAPSANWNSITSDSTGQYLAAVVNGGYIYTSSNYGSTWTQRASSQNWNSITSDSTGKYLAATVNNGNIYTSSNSGSTWTLRESSRNWNSITSDSTGQYLAAVVNNGYIYTSSNYGSNWTQRASLTTWKSIASDSTGQYLTAVYGTGTTIYYSKDRGNSWNQIDMGSSKAYSLVAMNYSGNISTVLTSGGTTPSICVSLNASN